MKYLIIKPTQITAVAENIADKSNAVKLCKKILKTRRIDSRRMEECQMLYALLLGGHKAKNNK